MTDRSKYESHDHRSDQALPLNVEIFLIELFREPNRFNPSEENEKLKGDDDQDDERDYTAVGKFPMH